MTRKYVKAKKISDEVQKLREEGKTKRKIAEMYGLIKEQIKIFCTVIASQNRLKKISY